MATVESESAGEEVKKAANRIEHASVNIDLANRDPHNINSSMKVKIPYVAVEILISTNLLVL